MKISCNIIRDLLPLYAEDLVSNDTRTLVDEHLRECEDCTKQFGIIKKAAQIPVDVDAGALKRVENTIRRKRVLAVLTALMLALTIVLGTALLLDARIYLTAEQAVDSVELLEDGSVFIRLTNYVIGYGSSRYPDNNIGFIAWTNLTKLLFGSKEHLSYEEFKSRNPAFETQLTEEDYKYMGGFTHSDAQNCNIWYCNGWTGEGERLLWDGGDLTRHRRRTPQKTVRFQHRRNSEEHDEPVSGCTLCCQACGTCQERRRDRCRYLRHRRRHRGIQNHETRLRNLKQPERGGPQAFPPPRP